MRSVLITGASSGIGAATAQRLAQSWRVVAVARRRDKLSELIASLPNPAANHLHLSADLRDPTACTDVVHKAEIACERLDALVLNAGEFTTAHAEDITAAHADALWQLNTRAPMLMAAAAIPHLAHGSSIIVVSSAAVDQPFTGCGAYAASKAALEAWARSAREELRPRGIRIGIIAPGATDTDIWPSESPFDRTRMTQASDVADAIALMLELPDSASVDRLVISPPGGSF